MPFSHSFRRHFDEDDVDQGFPTMYLFLLQCLEDLDRSLKKLNSRLFVIRGQPADALPKLFKEWRTTSLSFEEDPEPFGRVRDHNITAMCRENGVNVISRVSHTLYKLDRIIEKNGGRAPLTYNQFQTIIAGMEEPSMAEESLSLSNIGNAITPVGDDHDDKFCVPTLEELGFDTDGLQPPIWIGGESEALARLEKHLERKAWVASFGRPKMTPQSLLASKTGLSPYLRFGCLSTRLFYYQLTDLYKKIKKSQPPLSLHGQLLWREFFYCASTKNPNFDKMLGNPICVQIPWDKNDEALAKWANGQTGYPWIDAIMIQLREEGWIHHLARHAVACFLTRGDLWISWEEGMKVFEELLLDADWSVNAGTWMWLSCSSFFQQFFHCYCPVGFGRKADPYGDYIRKYIPALRNFPTQFIHAPWLAPVDIQEAANCVIGKQYPVPMVDHPVAASANIYRIKQVYRKLVKYKPQYSSITDKIITSDTTPSMINNLCVSTEYQNNNKALSQFHENVENGNDVTLSSDAKCKIVSDIFKENNQRDTAGLKTHSSPYKKIIVIEQDQSYGQKESADGTMTECKNDDRYEETMQLKLICTYQDKIKKDSNCFHNNMENLKKCKLSDNNAHLSDTSQLAKKLEKYAESVMNGNNHYEYPKKLNGFEGQKRGYNFTKDSKNIQNTSDNKIDEIKYFDIKLRPYQTSALKRKTDDDDNNKDHDCSLEEEHVRFQQGKTVMMQGCSRPDM